MTKRGRKRVSGSYLLLIRVQRALQISVGALKDISFSAGYYGYVGSALNNQLVNRCLRHAKQAGKKKTHWHIDYLLVHESTSLLKIMVVPSTQREECQLAQTVAEFAKKIIDKFGSSDCSCSSHLFYFGDSIPPFFDNL